MTQRRDSVEIGGRHITPKRSESGTDASRPRKFLSVWFRCCHTYGRLYRNREETAYTGRCPSCGAQVRALIGPGGTTRRCFEAR